MPTLDHLKNLLTPVRLHAFIQPRLVACRAAVVPAMSQKIPDPPGYLASVPAAFLPQASTSAVAKPDPARVAACEVRAPRRRGVGKRRGFTAALLWVPHPT